MGCSLSSKHTDLFTLLPAAPLYPRDGADVTAEEVGVFTRKTQTPQPTNTRQPLNTQLGNSTFVPLLFLLPLKNDRLKPIRGKVVQVIKWDPLMRLCSSL